MYRHKCNKQNRGTEAESADYYLITLCSTSYIGYSGIEQDNYSIILCVKLFYTLSMHDKNVTMLDKITINGSYFENVNN